MRFVRQYHLDFQRILRVFLKYKPSIQQGLRMRLWQLTDSSAKIAGFIRIPIFVNTEAEFVIEAEAETYVVPNMQVPV